MLRLEASSGLRTEGFQTNNQKDEEDQGLVSSEEVWTRPVM